MATHWEHSLSPSVQHLNKILAIFRSTCELHWLHGSDRTLQNKNTAHNGHKCGRLHAPAAWFWAFLCMLPVLFQCGQKKVCFSMCTGTPLKSVWSPVRFILPFFGERSPGHNNSRGSSCSLNLADPPFLLSGLKNEQNINPAEVQLLKFTSSWVFSGSDPGMKA